MEAGALANAEELGSMLRGPLLRPGDPGYDEHRRVWNVMIDKRPDLIARCTGVADVIACVDFARENGIDIAVRGGGHNVAGLGTLDGGLVADLSLMRSVRVDPRDRTVRAEPGVLLSEVDRETQAFGLAIVSGTVGDTGLAGLTLGAGGGWLSGKWGMAVDNLLEVDIVTADGQLRRASADSEPDLFWAIRGGGGNFGVVTSFKFRAHEVGLIAGGQLVFELSAASEILPAYAELVAGAPDELVVYGGLMRLPGGPPVLALAIAYIGPPEEAEPHWERLRALGAPIADTLGPRTWLDIQSMLAAGLPTGMRHYWKAEYVETIDRDLAGILAAGQARAPSPQTLFVIVPTCGAQMRVPKDATAFPHRDFGFQIIITAQWREEADTEANVRWTREVWHELLPYAVGGVYVNDLTEEELGGDRVRQAYGLNYERLARVKAAYDRGNLFHVNANIRPAPAPAAVPGS